MCSFGEADGRHSKPTAARRAFPCWDEPLLKATFAVTMISREDTVNLNNMPAISEEVYTPNFAGQSDLTEWLKTKFPANEEAGKWKVTRFETTPPMSSYIVAYANGPFKHIEDTYVSPLSGKTRPLRIYGASTCGRHGLIRRLSEFWTSLGYRGSHPPGAVRA